jgi:hypothetical protein
MFFCCCFVCLFFLQLLTWTLYFDYDFLNWVIVLRHNTHWDQHVCGSSAIILWYRVIFLVTIRLTKVDICAPFSWIRLSCYKCRTISSRKERKETIRRWVLNGIILKIPHWRFHVHRHMHTIVWDGSILYCLLV